MSNKRNKDIALDLYTGDGWVNIPAVAALGCWCNIIIGKRQVGKTFGTLKYMLDESLYFLYMRRTVNELQAVAADPDLNPFNALQSVGYDIGIQKTGKFHTQSAILSMRTKRTKTGARNGTSATNVLLAWHCRQLQAFAALTEIFLLTLFLMSSFRSALLQSARLRGKRF